MKRDNAGSSAVCRRRGPPDHRSKPGGEASRSLIPLLRLSSASLSGNGVHEYLSGATAAGDGGLAGDDVHKSASDGARLYQ